MTIIAAKQDQALKRVSAALIGQLEALLPTNTDLASARSLAQEEQLRDRLARAMVVLTDTLQTLSSPTSIRPESFAAHLSNRERAERLLNEVAQSVVGADDAAALTQQSRRLTADVRAGLETTKLPAAVETLFGPARLVDHLRGTLIDVVAVCLRHQRPLLPTAATEATRALMTVLSERHPGAAIEVRVPPAAAVQVGAIGAGSSHTRGTPPNVVELGIEAFLDLALGRRDWPQLGTAIYASGAHASDVAQMMPLINLGTRPLLSSEVPWQHR